MSLIKDRIIESAVRHFSEKGYLATSIQDISDDCGIAKGSLYKYFQSKEDLFREVHVSRIQNLREQLETIREHSELTPREVFIRETEIQFEFFMVNRFIMQEIKELTKSDGQMTTFFLQLKSSLLNFHKEGLIRLVGDEIIPNIWDLVVMYNGIVREYIFLLVFEDKPLIIRDITSFIVDRIEEMAASILQKKPLPVLSDSLMNECVKCGMEGIAVSADDHRNALLAVLLTTVKELSVTNAKRTQLKEAVEALQDEFKQERPKLVVMQALLVLLEQEHELKYFVWQLNRHLIRYRHKLDGIG
ncbi:TetR/AcrR family transcriptional regulator [Paenibacillus sepulcri]|uniref:TetR/AcrR family transcriptional regulator n=1 Tax=Paenibacillus sepulcri TaxID=359917 RepID=A0ABS7C8A2_9BACL|nr:TetR/AcrR family transcriptional regulator [Paenibacillus sepulcri]